MTGFVDAFFFHVGTPPAVPSVLGNTLGFPGMGDDRSYSALCKLVLV